MAHAEHRESSPPGAGPSGAVRGLGPAGAGPSERPQPPPLAAAGERSFLIAVTTYRRPDGLRRLLTSFEDLAWPATWRFGGVLVVDNDPAGTAGPIVAAYRNTVTWPVGYVVERTPGVVAARNRALREAVGVTHVAMIDDDEVIDSGWPSGLLEVAERTGADLTGGVVVPLPEAEVPDWMLRPKFLGRDSHPDGAEVQRLSSGNLLVSRALLVDGADHLFDPRFARSGGEDSHLCGVVRARGGQLRWSATARTYEVLPPERCSLTWLRRRWRRTGATMTMVDLALADGRRQRAFRRVKAVVVGVGRVVVSVAAIGRTGPERASLLRQRNQGIGQVAGAFGSTPAAYGPGGFESPA